MNSGRHTTDALDEILQAAKPEDLGMFLKENGRKLIDGDRPFSAYMRERLRKKDLRQQDVFLAADIPEGYGYKLISEEKHTRQRDVLLRLCLGASFSLLETQRALKIYGMSPLYSKVPRDAVFIIAFNTGINEIAAVDEMLLSHGMEPLKTCGTAD